MGDSAMTRVKDRGRHYGLERTSGWWQARLVLRAGTNAESRRTTLELCMVVHVSNPSTQEAKARGPRVHGQPLEESLSYNPNDPITSSFSRPHLFQVPPPFKVTTLGKITAKPFLKVTKPEQMRLNLYTHLLQRLLGHNGPMT